MKDKQDFQCSGPFFAVIAADNDLPTGGRS
jgi:hypothetical protein